MSDAAFPSRRGLTGDALKLLAILAMTLDHIAWLLFPGYPAQAMPLAMHIIGRLTCPIMCYFIAEGYHYTRNFRRYALRRLSRTLLISTPPMPIRIGAHSFPFIPEAFSTRRASCGRFWEGF